MFFDSKSVGTEQGWFDAFRERFNLNGMMEKLDLSKSKLIDIGIYLGVGFLSGFLLKKYAKYVALLIAFIIALIFLDKAGIVKIVVDSARAQEVLGIQVTTPIDGNTFATLWELLKQNIIVVLSFSIGFLLGLKVG